jgi:hypothetical protein
MTTLKHNWNKDNCERHLLQILKKSSGVKKIFLFSLDCDGKPHHKSPKFLFFKPNNKTCVSICTYIHESDNYETKHFFYLMY